MAHASKDIPPAGTSASRDATARWQHAVALTAAGVLRLRGCVLAALLWLVAAQPDMPLALTGFVAAVAVGWVGFVLTRPIRQPFPSTQDGLLGPSHEETL